MPYLDQPWMVGGRCRPAGTWVPERDWDRWERRGNLPGGAPWRMRPDWAPPPKQRSPEPSAEQPAPEPSAEQPVSERSPEPTPSPPAQPADSDDARKLAEEVLPVLAADIVSAQRDRLVYTNLIERLKSSPSDATADALVDEMITLGFASASWPSEVGGPPPRGSLRPWKQVLNWLLRQAAKVATFLFDCVDRAIASLRAFGVTAVAVGLSWAPEVSFEFLAETAQTSKWPELRKYFIRHMVAELHEDMF